MFHLQTRLRIFSRNRYILLLIYVTAHLWGYSNVVFTVIRTVFLPTTHYIHSFCMHALSSLGFSFYGFLPTLSLYAYASWGASPCYARGFHQLFPQTAFEVFIRFYPRILIRILARILSLSIMSHQLLLFSFLRSSTPSYSLALHAYASSYADRFSV